MRKTPLLPRDLTTGTPIPLTVSQLPQRVAAFGDARGKTAGLFWAKQPAPHWFPCQAEKQGMRAVFCHGGGNVP